MRSDLPTGTVTFLFTDVEGSTKLLHELGAEGYAAALAEHRRVIREACARHDGFEVDTQGDAFFFAFPTAPGALAAAGEMTDALGAGPIQVRIGLHTGTPHQTEEGYVGDDVHFAARVAASGRGGQILVSSATAALIESSNSLLQGALLHDLGEHRLKDIAEAVSIFQVGYGSFPPLKTISNTNLPRPASSFVGREAELAEVLARIEGGARLVTLTGPGGSGKTRLALEAASSLVPEYTAGVFWIGLASLRDPALVTETVSQTLGAKDGLADHISEREMLLLLDNLEQVIEAAPQLSSLLSSCPNLTLLVTSRELLRVSGEVEYSVPPLAAPEAVILFCERAQLEPSEEIGELCARLDSLPLAVELAAARTKALSPKQILERLSQRLDLLKGGRDADPRQQTLRATIEWSYDLLSPEEQQLFARLSVFAGGCTLEAAEEVSGADLDTLQSLVEKSLLRVSNERYWMLETIREFAAELLDKAGQAGNVRQRHAGWVLALVMRVESEIEGPEASAWFSALSREQDNVRTAIAFMEETRQTGMQLELVGSIRETWQTDSAWLEARRWAESALARSVGERSARRARTLGVAANCAAKLGDLTEAEAYAEESLALFRELGDGRETAMALGILGSVRTELGDPAEYERLLEEAQVVAREAGEARIYAIITGNLGDTALRRGDYGRATALTEEALTVFRELGLERDRAWALYNLAFTLLHTNREEESVAAARESLMLSHQMGVLELLPWILALLASVAVRRGDQEEGARMIGAADAIRERTHLVLTGVEAELYRGTVEMLDRMLSPERCAAAFAEGRQMTLDDSVAHALSSID